jgi:hypothetical protein
MKKGHTKMMLASGFASMKRWIESQYRTVTELPHAGKSQTM